jgi:hypothetical protein
MPLTGLLRWVKPSETRPCENGLSLPVSIGDGKSFLAAQKKGRYYGRATPYPLR